MSNIFIICSLVRLKIGITIELNCELTRSRRLAQILYNQKAINLTICEPLLTLFNI